MKKMFSCGHFGRVLANVLLLGASQAVLFAGPNKGAGNAAFPPVNLPEVSRGAKAAEALGAHLPEVAKAYGLTREELVSRFAHDETLSVDRQGRLHYVEPALPQGATGAT